jgi:hypothetical protein
VNLALFKRMENGDDDMQGKIEAKPRKSKEKGYTRETR